MTTHTKHARKSVAVVQASTAGPFGLSFSDAEQAGQVLMWSPEGAGDFADIAWVIAGLLGNGAGVRGLDVHRSLDGDALHADVSATSAAYVAAVAAGHGWRLYAPDDTYPNTYGAVGEILVNVTWLSPDRAAVTEVSSAGPAGSAVAS